MSNPAYGYGSNYAYSGLASLHNDRFPPPSAPAPAPADPLSADEAAFFRTRYTQFTAPPPPLPPAEVALPHIRSIEAPAPADPFSGDEHVFFRTRYSQFTAPPPPLPPAEVSLPHICLLEDLYHPPYPGQIEAQIPIYTQDFMVKRPRVGSKLPVYPQRPGEKDCAHYMLTRTCKFGETCKFDHPIWVPKGGLPDWKETPHVPVPVPAEDSLPEKPGEPDCPFYMKTSTCKFGAKCKFNHPKGVVNKNSEEANKSDKSALPERPSEPLCSFFAKTGMCKFGANCKFNHPKDLHKTLNGENEVGTALSGVTADPLAAIMKPSGYSPAVLYNSKGLPIRPDEVDCTFYLKTGSCKYGSACRFNHPDRSVFNPPLAASIVDQVPASVLANLPLVAANILQNFDLHSISNPSHIAGPLPTAYPQRPGETECDFYMKTGQCKFGEKCKFHHPLDHSAVGPDGKKQTVTLTLAGLPRREGAAVCAFYMKTATCKFGVTCKFDHPPPGELVAMATEHGTSSTEPGPEEVNPVKVEEGEGEEENGEEEKQE